jgi:very-short-patch-repair endonuclease
MTVRGYRVLRIPALEVWESVDDVMETIFHALMGDR